MSYRTAPAALLSLLALPALALADPGVMMHMNSSVKMQMPGMAMPPQAYSQEICVPEHHDVRDAMQHSRRNKDCTISNYQITAAGGSFHYVCGGQMPMQGDAHFTPRSDGGAQVTIDMSGDMHGQPMTMQMHIDTTPTGASCSYTPPAR